MRLARNACCAWLAALFLCVGLARANSILYASHTPLLGGGGAWDYTVFVTPLAEIRTDDFFVVIDFAGYVDGSIFAPTGWAATVEQTTDAFETGTGTITPVNDGGAMNLRFTRTGGTIPNPPIGAFLSGFGAITTLDGVGPTTIVAQDHSTLTGDTAGNTSVAFAPAGIVPLPAAAWGGMALFGVLGGVKLRRSRQSVMA
jgi:hypothetical protein